MCAGCSGVAGEVGLEAFLHISATKQASLGPEGRWQTGGKGYKPGPASPLDIVDRNRDKKIACRALGRKQSTYTSSVQLELVDRV